MIDFIASVVLVAGTGGATLWGYLKARKFVRERLRFVDSAQTPVAPIVAGTVAAIVAAPVVWLLPVLGVPTALIFGLGVGAGVMHGARDIRKSLPPG